MLRNQLNHFQASIRMFFAILASFGFFFAGCLNPVGFPVDVDLKVSGEVDVNITEDGKKTALPDGSESGNNQPNRPVPPSQGALIIKNITGGGMAAQVSVAVTREGKKYGPLVLEPGYEKSLTLDMASLAETVEVSAAFAGTGSPAATSKVMVRGQSNYLYFYCARNGDYKISTGNSEPVADIDYSNYSDEGNTGGGDNGDNDNRANPAEGDTSGENDPRTRLPASMKSDYGIVIVHNVSGSETLDRALFDQGTGDSLRHYEMNPGPGKGSRRSIVLRRGTWTVTAFWGIRDTERAVLSPFEVKPAGAGNIVNYLFFYRDGNGDYRITGETDTNLWQPPLDQNDYKDNSAPSNSGGNAQLSSPGEGNSTNSGIDSDRWIDISGWDYRTRQELGILTIKNLSVRAGISSVTFTRSVPSAAQYPQGGAFSVRAGRDRAIVLGKSPGDWDITVTYSAPDSAGTTLKTYKTLHPAGITRYINYLYFYKGSDGNYHLGPLEYSPAPGAYTDGKSGLDDDAPPDPGRIDQNSGGGAPLLAGGREEGSAPGILDDTNNLKYGMFILKNLTQDVDVTEARYTPGIPGNHDQANGHALPYTMNPGPARLSRTSIVLGPDTWAVAADYAVSGGANGTIHNQVVMPGAGMIVEAYFYKMQNGQYSISDNYPPPYIDYTSNSDPSSIINDNEGYLLIHNLSSFATIESVQYLSNGNWVSVHINPIAPSDSSDPRAVLPVGTWPIRFKTATKSTYSSSVTKTIRIPASFSQEPRATEVNYTDALDSDNPPSGFGTLRIVNQTPDTIVRVDTQTRNTANVYERNTLQNFTVAPYGQTGSSVVQVLWSGGASLSSEKAYIVQCYIDDATFYEEVAQIRNGQITSIIIQSSTPKVTATPANPDLKPGEGGLIVYNRYGGELPLKIYSIYLYRQMDDGSGSFGNGYVNRSHNEYPHRPQADAVIPARADLIFNDPAGDNYGNPGPNPDNYLVIGEKYEFKRLQEGNYKILVIAGSFDWNYYTANPRNTDLSGSIIMNPARITYDCGEIFITKKTKKVYSFNPVAAEADVPDGYVTVKLSHGGGNAGSYGYSASTIETQFVSASILSPFGQPDANGVMEQRSTTSVDAAVARRHIVLSDAVPLAAGETRTYYLPPRTYGARMYDPTAPRGGGDRWSGRPVSDGETRYCDLDLRSEGGKTVFLSWYWPNIRILSSLGGGSFLPVDETLLSLSATVDRLTAGASLQQDFDLIGGTQFQVSNYQWFVSSTTGSAYNTYYYPAKSGNLVSEITTGLASHRIQSGRHYTLLLNLEAEPGLTFANVVASGEAGPRFNFWGHVSKRTGDYAAAETSTTGWIQHARGAGGTIQVIIRFPKVP